MVHPEVAIYPYIGHSDGHPSRWSQLQTGEVKGSNIIGVMLKAAVYTPEEGLASPVSFIDAPTSWAGYGSVLWLSIDDWYPSFKSLIFDKGLELSESPTMEVPVLVFPMLSVHTDSRKLLHYDYVAFPECVRKRPADLMQNSIDVSPLSSAQPFQPPFSGGCAFSLERGTELPKTMSFSKDFSAFSFEAVRSDEKVLHSNVYADWIVSFRFWNLLFNGDVKEESFVFVNQDSMRWLGIFEKFSLVVACVKGRLNPLLKRRDGGINSIGLVDKPKKPLIQIHRKPIELKKLISFLLVRFGNPISGSDGEVCWKLELLPRLSVNHVVKSYWVEHSSLKRYFRNMVTRIPKSLKCGKKLLCILSTRLKFADYGFREPHSKKHICKLNYLSFKPQFLSTTKVGSLLEMLKYDSG